MLKKIKKKNSLQRPHVKRASDLSKQALNSANRKIRIAFLFVEIIFARSLLKLTARSISVLLDFVKYVSNQVASLINQSKQ